MDFKHIIIGSALVTGLSVITHTAWAGTGVDRNKPKNDYNITINYELGMHCTGFDFSYCCVLPPYNSIQSQVVKTATGPKEKPVLLGADPNDPMVLVDGGRATKIDTRTERTPRPAATPSRWSS